MKCPKCEEQMEEGYVFLPPTRGAVVFWSKNEPTSRDMWTFRGEWIRLLQWSLGKRDKKYWLHRSFRCSNCKIVLFSYEDGEKKEESAEG